MMFETLTQPNTSRIDYFADPRLPQPEGVGLYVSGMLHPGQPYSREAKQALMVGLCLILHTWLAEHVAAIYVDVASWQAEWPPAYNQMKQDLARGFIRRILVANPRFFHGKTALLEDWQAFRRQHAHIEWYVPAHNLARVLPLRCNPWFRLL
ncbi:hypothetical protein [uncultured Thermanaerothrix sp.]|uniref:hypothetical protein n=1 Tax=uncultured Thermanaerothrix sp. TaxID=1195149 RepID=UPI00260D2954|nr:hypothetical protein [uncultured Thermanaerothrix sp.]